ncbi:MAG: hypothetical protein PUF50_00620 [Erysipelotrichaceae bacterium]|nr:hypothetical protein [Erysipelotrichaceae bacterium]
MKTKIKFYGGLDTIGGVVMSIVYGKERILLEIGTAYDPATDVFDGHVKHRDDHYLYDELCLHRAPLVEGLYAKKDIEDFPLLAQEDSDLHTSIFITHMHLDHMSCMGLVSDDVDVYLSEPAKRLEEALETTGKGVYTLRTKGYQTLDPNKEYQIGKMILKPFLINDQSYQDYSFYIKTPDMKLHYTGDVVLHGNYAENVWKEMEYIKNEHVDVLVCDTTSLMDSTMIMMYQDVNAEIIGQKEIPEGMLSKAMVNEALCEQLKNEQGLCVFNFYEREMEEVRNFQSMAKRCNRIIAFEPETAYLIWKFFDEMVNVYVPDKEYDQQWFYDLLEHNSVITKKEIYAEPNKYLIQNTYEHLLELLDLPNQNASYLHSGGMPMGAYDPAYENLQRVLKLSGFTHINFFMNRYFTHAYPQQLKYYCDQIDAKVLIPTHGYQPERLLATNGRMRLLPKKYATYVLDGEQLVEVTE